MVTAPLGAMQREAPFREADAGSGEHLPFAEQHRVNAKQLARRGAEKNEYCDGGESGAAPCRRRSLRLGGCVSGRRIGNGHGKSCPEMRQQARPRGLTSGENEFEK